MDARYLFRVRFRLEPSGGVRVEPREFETRLSKPADEPGEEGWLFFRDTEQFVYYRSALHGLHGWDYQ